MLYGGSFIRKLKRRTAKHKKHRRKRTRNRIYRYNFFEHQRYYRYLHMQQITRIKHNKAITAKKRKRKFKLIINAFVDLVYSKMKHLIKFISIIIMP